MGGSSKRAVTGYQWHLGVHMALCHGPVDAITAIEVDRRVAWRGLNDGTEVLTVDAPELFGGKKAEGGVSGPVDIEMGDSSQIENAYLQTQLGDDIPAYRGVVCAVLKQCYMGNNPYLKPWAFRTTRIHVRQDGLAQWYDEKAEIPNIEYSNSLDGCGYHCDAFDDYMLSAGLWNYMILSDDKASGNIPTHDETGQGNHGYYNTDVNTSISYEDLPAMPGGCDVNFMRVLAGTAAPTSVLPSEDNTYFGSSVACGAILRQSNTSGAVEFPLLAIVRFRGESGARLLWNRSTGVLRISSYKPSEGPFYFVLSIPPPPTGVAFLAQLSLDLYTGACTSLLVWTDELGHVHNYSQTVVVPVDLTVLPWTTGLACVVTNVGDVGYDVHFDYRSSWIFDGAPGSNQGMIDAFLASTPLSHACAECADMNPAHIVRECLTDPDWGMGYLDQDIDDVSFATAADQLYDEEMGISMLWDRDSPLEDFVDNIVRHIDAVLYVDRSSGKFVLVLIRSREVDSSTVLLNEGNVSSVGSAERPAMSELKSSVTVQFHDATIAEKGSVTVHNEALEQAQGAQNNESVEYGGFASRGLATRVAYRDLVVRSTPLLRCSIVSNRDAESLNMGDLFVLDWPDLLINDLPMRVSGISFGDGISNDINIEAVEDVFTLPSVEDVIGGDQAPIWIDPADIAPLAASPILLIEAPYYAVVTDQGELQTNTILDDEDHAGFLVVAAGRQAAEMNADVLIDSGAGYEDEGTLNFSPYAELSVAAPHTATRLYISSAADMDQVVSGSIAQIGAELVRFDGDGSDSNGDYVDVGRGVLDTVPQEHTAGLFIVFWSSYDFTDDKQYTDSDITDVKLLTTNGANTLHVGSAPVSQLVFSHRAIRPYAPGDLKINGQSYNFGHMLAGIMPLVTWAHRDREMQTGGSVIDHADGNIGPEPGTTYLLQCDSILENQTVVANWFSQNVGAVNSFGFTGPEVAPDSNLTLDSNGVPIPPDDTESIVFRVFAERDGFVSWQAAETQALLATPPVINLVVNGDFAVDLSSWNTISSILTRNPSGTCTVQRNGAPFADQFYQDIPTLIGQIYTFSALFVSASHSVSVVIDGTETSNWTGADIVFVATSTTTRLSINPANSGTAFAIFDDIAVIAT